MAAAAALLAHRVVGGQAPGECVEDAGDVLGRRAGGADVRLCQGIRRPGVQQGLGPAAPGVGMGPGPLEAGFERQGLGDDPGHAAAVAVPALDGVAPPDGLGPFVRAQARIVAELTQGLAQRRHVNRIEGVNAILPARPG